MSESVLTPDAVKLGLKAASKQDAIKQCADVLVAIGAAGPEYLDGIYAREEQISTYMGEGFAIPHGTNESRAHIHKASLAFLQFPDGVDWNGHQVVVCIPIASNSDEHIGILSSLAGVLSDPDSAEKLRSATSVDEVLALLAPEDAS